MTLTKAQQEAKKASLEGLQMAFEGLAFKEFIDSMEAWLNDQPMSMLDAIALETFANRIGRLAHMKQRG